MEKVSGFVYIWRDRKHKRYYIGSHWGSPDDGYICSSSWMKQAYRKRSSDFKRRILTVVIESRQSLYDEEMRILGMIKDHELGKRYYNFKKRTGHWYINDARRVEIGQKISKAITGVKQSPEQIQKRKNTIASKPALTREQIVERRAKRLEIYRQKRAAGWIAPITDEARSKAHATCRRKYAKGWRGRWEGHQNQSGYVCKGRDSIRKPVSLRGPDGSVHHFKSLTEAAKMVGASVNYVASGRNKQIKGWTLPDAPESHRDKRTTKSVSLISPSGELVRFETQNDAAEAVGISASGITALVTGTKATGVTNGWTSPDFPPKAKRTTAKKVELISPHGELVIFDSLREAGKAIKSTSIYYLANGRVKSSNGWRLAPAKEA